MSRTVYLYMFVCVSDPVAGSSHTAADSTVRILVLGKKGSGKSSSGNTIVGQKVFSSPKRYKEKVTKTCEKHTCHVGGKKVCVIDTPDLLDTDIFGDELHRETDKLVSLCQAGLHAVLLVVSVGQELQNEEEMLEFMKALLGSNIQKFIMVLFTRGDELEEDETIEQHIQDTQQGKELETLIERCSGHFHAFNNRELVEDQVTGLLDKITNLVKSNGGVFLMGRTRRISMDWGMYCELSVLHVNIITFILTFFSFNRNRALFFLTCCYFCNLTKLIIYFFSFRGHQRNWNKCATS